MLGFKSIHDYREFADAVQSKRRFFHTEIVTAFLKAVSNGSKKRQVVVSAGQTLWRAQVGSRDWQRTDAEGHEWVEDAPFLPERMVPPPRIPPEGRINPRGIAYFYLASDRRTAISEVGPSNGSLVTIAQFEITRELKLANFSERYGESGGLNYLLDIPIDQWDELSQDQIDQAVWTDIDNAFSLPVSANDEHLNYIPTQIIAESLLVEKYDGVIYKSALNQKGYNIALFDVSSAIFRAARLFSVTNVKYEFTEYNNPWFLEGDEYFTQVMTNIRPIGDAPCKEEEKTP